MKKFYITTPIYYVNDQPHIGHAYTTIAADIIARYYRMVLGSDKVFYLTGTDEHGAKVAQSAEEEGMTPKKFADKYSARYKLTWDSLSISNDDFIRTTEKRHEKIAEEFLLKLKDSKTPKGNLALYEDEYEGLYCIGCESYKTEEDLVDGKCPDHLKKPEYLKEKNWFFRLSDYTENLKKLIEKDEISVQPESKKKEILGFLKQGLKDVAITRRQIKWGIKVPFDKKQVVYVWVEALMNYISALGGQKGDLYKKFWPADIHLMAKDIIRFHAVIWPAMLLAIGLPLPKTVFAHGFFTINGQKMSKTLGNVIDPNDLVSKYGSDATRYLLLSQFPFGSDGDISEERLVEKYNSDLANGLGNLVNRVVAMTDKYFDGKVLGSEEQPLEIDKCWLNYHNNFKVYKLESVIETIRGIITWADSYVEKNKPWELAKTDKDKLAEVLYHLLETIRHLAWMIGPFMPDVSEKIFETLGIPKENDKKTLEEAQNWGGLEFGSQVKKGEALFPRL